MYEPFVSVVNTSRRIVEKNQEEFNLTLKIELEKQRYVENILSFYHKRNENIRNIIKEGVKNLKPLRKSIVNEIGLYYKITEEIFFVELKDMFLKKLFNDPFLCCDSMNQGMNQDIKFMEVNVSEIKHNFRGYSKLELVLPKKKMKSSLFGNKMIVESLPNLTYYYYLSGIGLRHTIETLIQSYAKQAPVPVSFDKNFVDSEWIILDKLRKSSDSGFEIQTIGKVITEEYGGESDVDIQQLNFILFDDKKEGLLGKLAFDNGITHEVKSNNSNELFVEVKSRANKFRGQIKIERNDLYLPMYLSFNYVIEGTGDILHYDKFLREYWPSTSCEELEDS